VPRLETIRSQVQRLIHIVPFRRFVLTLENGERAVIKHPENIAFDLKTGGADDFYIVTGKLRMVSTFGAVAAVIFADHDDAAA